MPTYPLNAWYAAAWDVEIGRTLLARTVCDQQLVLYRKLDGGVAALEDACWHRLLPLSMGRLDGDSLVCGYHGMAFAPNGRCTRMPSQEKLNPSACVRMFPALERHRLIWVWPGEPTLADPALIPDMHWLDDTQWAADGKRIPVRCDYRLVVDNLMDLTHETYVHGTSIGNEDVVHAPFTTHHSERTATLTRWMENIEAPPFWADQLRKPGPVDRWQIIRFEAPCTVTIDVGVAPAGSGARTGDRSAGVAGMVLNTITPQSDGHCHYFWAFARNYRTASQALTHELREGVARIFREDETVLEAQQRAIEAHPERGFYNLNIDTGSVWARKLIDMMIERESAHRKLQPGMPHSGPAQSQ